MNKDQRLSFLVGAIETLDNVHAVFVAPSMFSHNMLIVNTKDLRSGYLSVFIEAGRFTYPEDWVKTLTSELDRCLRDTEHLRCEVYEKSVLSDTPVQPSDVIRPVLFF